MLPATEPPFALSGATADIVSSAAVRNRHDTHFWRQPEAGVFFLRGAYVYSSDGLILSYDNELFNEFSHGWSPDLALKGPYYKPFATFSWNIQELDRPAAVIALPGTVSYYHWLLQALPRVHLLEEFLGHINHFIVADHITGSQEESLRLLGIAGDRLLRVGKNEKIFCRELFVPSIPADEGAISGWVIQFLRTLATKTASNGSNRDDRKVYLVRGKNGKRPIENEEDVQRALTQRGYLLFDGYKLSFAEQMRIMAQSKIVVGVLGAALSNIVFCHEAKILEIFPRDTLALNCYYPLAHNCGHRYWWMLAEACAMGKGACRIDISALHRALDLVESS